MEEVEKMIFDNIFTQNSILGSAMQAAVIRNNIISNNIANADVPGFKKKSVQFENYLAAALKSSKRGEAIDFDKISPTIQVEQGDFFHRMDGNNVDVEEEMVSLYQNTIKYDTLTSGIINNYKRINLVITGINK